jgi:hypothetical protein
MTKFPDRVAPMGRIRRLAVLAACFGVLALAGCAIPGTTGPAANTMTVARGSASAVAPASDGRPASSAPSPGASPPGVNVGAFDALARQEASAWAKSRLAAQWRSGLVVLSAGSLSSGPSGGFPSDEDKEAFINGDLVFTGALPTATPPGIVTWPDGTTMKVPVLNEGQAFRELTSSRQCPDCVTTPLDVTAARPAALEVATSRGRASVPAWSFTLRGVSTPVIQAALPPGSYVTPDTYGTPAEKLGPLGSGFVGAATATVSADGRTLTLGLPGSPCDTTWGGLVTETGGAIVVGGWMRNPDPGQACAAVLVLRSATVRLAAPVGDRVILDAAAGQPVTREP